MSKIYLASGFHWRDHLRDLAKRLEAKRHWVVSEWIWLEERPERRDDDYAQFAQRIAGQNIIDLLRADAIVVDMQGVTNTNHGGVHFETGFMVARGKPVYVVGMKSTTFHWLPEIFHVPDYETLLEKYL